MFERDAMTRFGLFADPGDEGVDLGISAPGVLVDGLTFGLIKDRLPICGKGEAGQQARQAKTGGKQAQVASVHLVSLRAWLGL